MPSNAIPSQCHAIQCRGKYAFKTFYRSSFFDNSQISPFPFLAFLSVPTYPVNFTDIRCAPPQLLVVCRLSPELIVRIIGLLDSPCLPSVTIKPVLSGLPADRQRGSYSAEVLNSSRSKDYLSLSLDCHWIPMSCQASAMPSHFIPSQCHPIPFHAEPVPCRPMPCWASVMTPYGMLSQCHAIPCHPSAIPPHVMQSQCHAF